MIKRLIDIMVAEILDEARTTLNAVNDTMQERIGKYNRQGDEARLAAAVVLADAAMAAIFSLHEQVQRRENG